MVCSTCGQELSNDVKFCTKCGTECRELLVKTPWEYFTDVLKKYAVFRGRARRAEFWWYSLFMAIFSIVVSVFDSILGLSVMGYGVLSILLTLGAFIPGLSVSIRRMHDCDKSGWYYLIPIYNFILCCTRGTNGQNRYGSDPMYVPQDANQSIKDSER